MEAFKWLSDGKLRKCKAEGIAVLIQSINVMHVEDTWYLTDTIPGLAAQLNLPVTQAKEGVRQLESADAMDVFRDAACEPYLRCEQSTCDMSQNVTGLVTLVSRRRRREYSEREKARLRKQKQRNRDHIDKANKNGHADVTVSVPNTHAGARAPSLSSSYERREKASEEENVSPREGSLHIPKLEDVRRFFRENRSYFGDDEKRAMKEAEKFYANYDGVGWTKGRFQQPITNWRSVAKLWMLKDDEFKRRDDGGPSSIDNFREVD